MGAVSPCDRQAAALTSATGARLAACLSPWFTRGWHGRVSTASMHQGEPHNGTPAGPLPGLVSMGHSHQG